MPSQIQIRMMDKVQKLDHCMNIPPSRCFTTQFLLCFNFSTVNCVLTNVRLYVHPVAVLGPTLIISFDKGMLYVPVC
jgi:hypothetical protein